MTKDWTEVALRECEPWCMDGDGHPHDHPDDRHCYQGWNPVDMTMSKPHPMGGDGVRPRWFYNRVDVILRRDAKLTEPNIVLGLEDLGVDLDLTLAEAVEIAETVNRLVALARGSNA